MESKLSEQYLAVFTINIDNFKKGVKLLSGIHGALLYKEAYELGNILLGIYDLNNLKDAPEDVLPDIRSLLNEMVLICYYHEHPKNLDPARKYIDILMLSPYLYDERTIGSLYSKMNFYLKPLQIRRSYIIPNPADAGYLPLNPCLFEFNSKLIINCRNVNYSIGPKNIYQIRDVNNIVRTRNFLLFDNEFKDGEIKSSAIEIIDPSPVSRGMNIVGCEDLRFFTYHNKWYAFTTKLFPKDETDGGHPPRVGLITFKDLEKGEIESVRLIPGPTPGRCEKNWLPFIEDDKVKFIYSFGPFTIYTLNLETLEIQREVEYLPTLQLTSYRIRGSAGPVTYQDGSLYLIHETGRYNDERLYFMRFIWIDNNREEIKVSRPFYCLMLGIEYSLSMLIRDNKLLIGLGLRDVKARVLEVDLSVVDSLLEGANHGQLIRP